MHTYTDKHTHTRIHILQYIMIIKEESLMWWLASLSTGWLTANEWPEEQQFDLILMLTFYETLSSREHFLCQLVHLFIPLAVKINGIASVIFAKSAKNLNTYTRTYTCFHTCKPQDQFLFKWLQTESFKLLYKCDNKSLHIHHFCLLVQDYDEWN